MNGLGLLRVIPSSSVGKPRDTCESCGLYLWSEGGYRISGLKGLFCSLTCVECAIAERTSSKKKIRGAPIGSGARLLLYLKTTAPGIYAELAQGGEAPDSKRCLECGTTLKGKRTDSEFCGPAHRMRFRKSRTDQNREISAKMPIGKQGLSEAQNAGYRSTTKTDA